MSREKSEVLRRAIRASGLSANELAKRAKVPQTVVSRFLRGEGITLETGLKIAAYLGLELK